MTEIYFLCTLTYTEKAIINVNFHKGATEGSKELG